MEGENINEEEEEEELRVKLPSNVIVRIENVKDEVMEELAPGGDILEGVGGTTCNQF